MSHHAFGPTPGVEVSRSTGFRPEVITSSTGVAERIDRPVSIPTQASSIKSAIRAGHGAGTVSGSVTNVFGRGLRGMRVEVVDDDKTVVGMATTAADGLFMVDHVPPGTYKLRALDEDGDFEKSWFDGRTFDTAKSFKVSSERDVDDVVVVLRSTATIDVDVTATKRRSDVVVMVTHRATGAPATGTVELSTKVAEIAVSLVDGRAGLSLAVAKDSESKKAMKLRVDYCGDHQTRPASTKVALQ